jgi:hypothetical protein
VTVVPCFNPRGESTPPLLVFPEPKRVLQDLTAMHQRSLWVAISSKGRVDRRVFREECQWFAECIVQRRIAMGMLPAEPAVLVVDKAPICGDLATLQFLAEKNIIVVTLPPRLTHVLQPIDVCRARSFTSSYRRFLKVWIKEDASIRAYSLLGLASLIGARSKAGESRASIAFAVVDAAKAATVIFTASRGFSVTGSFPFDVREPLGRKCVPCDDGMERERRGPEAPSSPHGLDSPDRSRFPAALDESPCPKGSG